MDDKIAINYRGKVYKYNKNTTFLEISKDFRDDFKKDILCALVDNEVTELSEKLVRSCFIEFLDLENVIANRIYEKGLLYIYMYAIKEIMGKDTSLNVEFSIDKGIYTTINKPINQYIVDDITKKMKLLINENIKFEKVMILRKEAIKYFEKTNRLDKAKILKYISNSYITLYKFKDMYDYFYSEMPYSSSVLDEFKLDIIENEGIVLSYPHMYIKKEELHYSHHAKLYDAFKEYSNYQKTINITTISDLNNAVSTNQIGKIIRIDEMFQNEKLLKISKEIYNKKDKIKIVLIAGPSSSGKTTTSKKISMYLEGLGLKPYSLSLDDFFKERYETPKDENDNYDFESKDAIDINLFNDTLEKLLNKEEVLMPTYNFLTGKKEYKNKLQINENNILIIEGLHGLNEELTSKIPREAKCKIYLSPLTNLNIDRHNRLHTTDTRLLRRMLRDNRTRGINPSQTIKYWKEVRKGEEKNIFIYQDDCDYIFNTALVYELGVLKTYVEPLLFSIDAEDFGYSEALRLINLLRNFLPIPSDEVPQDSILREFIQNSCFE